MFACFPGKSGEEDDTLYTQLFEHVFELVQNDSDRGNQYLVTAQFVQVSHQVCHIFAHLVSACMAN